LRFLPDFYVFESKLLGLPRLFGLTGLLDLLSYHGLLVVIDMIISVRRLGFSKNPFPPTNALSFSIALFQETLYTVSNNSKIKLRLA
jgi:hypothetical protein